MVDAVKANLLHKCRGDRTRKSAMNKTKTCSSINLHPPLLPPDDQIIQNNSSSVTEPDKQTLPAIISPEQEENLPNHKSPSKIEKDLKTETTGFSGEIMSENHIFSSGESLDSTINGISAFAGNLDASMDFDVGALSEEPDAARWGRWTEEDLIGGHYSPANPDLEVIILGLGKNIAMRQIS